jgi:hypothetical protein
MLPLDLHVLGTPPALILSQDQTLHKNRAFENSKNKRLTIDEYSPIWQTFLINCTTELLKSNSNA